MYSGGLAFLALAICGAAFVIADVLFGTVGAAATVVAAAALIAGLWFALPLARQLEDESGSDD